ncbi:Ribosomal protein L6 [Trypanosoma melophagium]|uniref:Ribosomal protein L6 n=1 Tax=Trypanosoma melophagium TaxID=715481 RepID=UPI00351A2A12|nr:Ribosomal protein L6 [Trypanosoma melophagium]KAH9597674.1 Ribosomal protein L6 [Trypanosoma melophagium]
MKIKAQERITYPEGVEISVKDRVVTVKGSRGTLTKDLRHLQLDFRVNKSFRTFTAVRWFGNKINNCTINTALSLVRNMITGVTRGFRFKLRFAYAHFPISVSVEGQAVEIRNFLGEKRVRRQNVASDVKVYRTDPSVVKDELVLEGNDLEKVSREAALMHQLCLVKKKDIRKFLDGIYVQTKTNVVEEE